jgi:hypothetical protein
LQSAAFNAQNPKFYIGQKLSELKPTTQVPGAGAYNPSPEKIMKGSPSFSMKVKLGSSLEKKDNNAPGPGNYEIHLKDKKDAPKFGFGTSKRDVSLNKHDTPGPGAYRVNCSVADVPRYIMPVQNENFKFV